MRRRVADLGKVTQPGGSLGGDLRLTLKPHHWGGTDHVISSPL
jgi:hypothetical protein